MNWVRFRVAPVAAAIAACCVMARGHAQQTRQPLPLEPLGATGEAVFPAFEGWGPHKDGSIVLLLGYYNRNKATVIDIPVGPNNRIEPGGPDYGQPTRFEPSRQHGVFAIRVPKDFGNQKLTWTITANGHTSTVAFWTNPPYWIDFFTQRGDRQLTAGDQVRVRRPHAVWPAPRVRANALGEGWRSAHAHVCGRPMRRRPGKAPNRSSLRSAAVRPATLRRRSRSSAVRSSEGREADGEALRRNASAGYHGELEEASRAGRRRIREGRNPSPHQRRSETVPRSDDHRDLRHAG